MISDFETINPNLWHEVSVTDTRPPHFVYAEFKYSYYSDITKVKSWINENIVGRYYISNTMPLIVGFEDHMEATLFNLLKDTIV